MQTEPHRTPSNPEDLHESHTPEGVRARLGGDRPVSYLRDLVYGAIDGAVTTFAVVAGVAGAGLSPGIVIVLGVANLIADGFSMGASNFLGSRAEGHVRERTRREELEHIRRVPEGEREEIRQIYAAKGIGGDDLERLVDAITSDRALWVETMLTEEHGLGMAQTDPKKAASATFVAFLAVGAIPLAPYLLGMVIEIGDAFAWSAACTALAFLMVGAVKGRVVGRGVLRSALETLAVGGAAAVLAYAIGAALRGVAGV